MKLFLEMDIKPENAASALVGRILKNEWRVVKRLEKKDGDTGGFFSVCYIVESLEDNKQSFLKAINFHAFFQLFKGRSIIEILSEQTNAFQYERELLNRCKNNKLSKVALIIDEGEEFVSEYSIPNVPYLIFEMAEGSVRSHLTFAYDIDVAWKLKSLHDVAVGLQQLHGVNIGHQDLKPSNILLYNNGIVSKLGDLGRSLCSDIVAPHEEGGNFPGDFTYAPPEFLYRHIEPDLNKRMRATDLYLLGSLIVFYFSGANMTALIGKNLDSRFNWNNWLGSFNEIKDYLIDGFYKALKEFKESIENEELGNELTRIIEYCCFPYPDKRGHPQAKSVHGNQYDLQRTVSKLDVLSKKREILLKNVSNLST